MELELGRCLVVLSELWRNDPGSSSLRLSPLYVTLSGVFIRAAQSLARILSGMLDTFITPLKGFVHLENPNIDAATDTSPRRTGTFWTQNGPNDRDTKVAAEKIRAIWSKQTRLDLYLSCCVISAR